MNGAIAIATRDLRERKRIFVMAAALAVVPFVAAMFPAVAGEWENAIFIVAVCLALAMAWGTALVLGSTVVSREIAEKRFSFYLSKPISPAAIWAGKSIGALVTSILCLAIIAGPAAAVASAAEATWAQIATVIAIGSVVVFFGSHAVSTMVRSRSAWIAIDFVLAAIVVAAIYLMSRPLIVGGAIGTLMRVAEVLVAAVFVAMVVAPVVQIARGRADIRDSHAALSRVLWAVIGSVVLIAGAYILWLVTPSPEDVRPFEIDQSSTGAALIAGQRTGAARYATAFIADPATGEYHRLSYPLLWQPSWSRNGRVVAFGQPAAVAPSRRNAKASDRQQMLLQDRRDPRDPLLANLVLTGRPELFTSVDGGPPVGTGLPILGATFVLSDDGSRFAILRDGALSVYDLASRRLLASAQGFREYANHGMLFVSRDWVRVYEHERRGGRGLLTIHELDVRKRSLARSEPGAIPADPSMISLSGDATRMLIRATGTIADARTGQAVAALPVDNLEPAYSAMLNDGSVVVSARENDASRLRLFTRDGVAAGEVMLPHPRAVIVGETADGKLIVGGRPAPDGAGPRPAMFVVDRATAVLERTLDGVFGPTPARDSDRRLTRFAAGAPLVGTDADRRLIVWDARTGETRPFR